MEEEGFKNTAGQKGDVHHRNPFYCHSEHSDLLGTTIF